MIILSTHNSRSVYNVSCKDGAIVVHAAQSGTTLRILQGGMNALTEIPPTMAAFESVLRKMGCRRVKGNRWGAPASDALDRLK